MIEYRFAEDKHRADVLDFINYVFSQAHRPHNFKTLIPKVYGDGRGYSDIHAVTLEDGRVRGVVAQLPMNVTMGGEKLSIGYIGSVSTHPYARGAGYMIKLMDMQAKRAEESGIDVMMLGGQRQRYEYYGYSPVGEAYSYSINGANVRHGLKTVEAGDISFREFDEASPADVDKAYALYLKQPVTGARPREDFALIMRSWNAAPYLIYRGEDVIGYCVAAGHTDVSELILENAQDAPAFVKAWYKAHDIAGMQISVPGIDIALNREIAAFAEGYSLHNFSHLRIVNFKNVLAACLALKKAVYGLNDGEVVLQMDEGTPVRASVKGGKIEVTETTDAPDVKLPRLAMQQFLFAANRFAAPAVSAPVNWFPLPIYLYPADHF